MFNLRKSLRIGAAVLVAACIARTAPGQDDYHVAANTEAREATSEADLVARVAALEAQLKGSMSANSDAAGNACGCGGSGCCGCGGCCDTCCACNCDPCCRSEGFTYGAEVAFLAPHNTSGLGLNSYSLNLSVLGVPLPVPNPIFDGTIDPDLKATPRIWVGYQRADGLGVRARYWEFDHTFDGGVVVAGNPINATVFHNWDTWVLDLEVTDSTRLGCNWDVTFSYGYRHVDYDEVRGISLPGFVYAAGKRFNGDGVTTSAEFRRQASNAFSLYANVRASILVDDETNSVSLTSPGLFSTTLSERQTNDIKYIVETQAGVEYTAPVCGGGWYYARAGVELQYWDSFGASPIALLFDESAGFAGFSVSAGLMR